MKKGKKDFDCVKMQRDIRNGIVKEYEGFSLQEMAKRLVEGVHQDPKWSRYFEKPKTKQMKTGTWD